MFYIRCQGLYAWVLISFRRHTGGHRAAWTNNGILIDCFLLFVNSIQLADDCFFFSRVEKLERNKNERVLTMDQAWLRDIKRKKRTSHSHRSVFTNVLKRRCEAHLRHSFRRLTWWFCFKKTTAFRMMINWVEGEFSSDLDWIFPNWYATTWTTWSVSFAHCDSPTWITRSLGTWVENLQQGGYNIYSWVRSCDVDETSNWQASPAFGKINLREREVPNSTGPKEDIGSIRSDMDCPFWSPWGRWDKPIGARQYGTARRNVFSNGSPFASFFFVFFVWSFEDIYVFEFWKG